MGAPAAESRKDAGLAETGSQWVGIGLLLTGTVLGVAVLTFWSDAPQPLRLLFGVAAAGMGLATAFLAIRVVRGLSAEIQEKDLYAERLRHAEERTRNILDAAGDGIITYDENWMIRSFNRAAARIFEYEPEEVLGTKVWTLVSGHTTAGLRLDTQEVVILGAGSVVEGHGKSGNTILLEPAISKVRSGRGLLTTMVLRDLTQRKRAEEELRHAKAQLEQNVRDRTAELAQANAKLAETIGQLEDANRTLTKEIDKRAKAQEELCASEARFQTLVRLAPDAIMIHRADQLVFANPAARQLFGTAGSLEGLTLSELFGPESLPRLRDYLRRVLEARRPMPSIELQVRRPGGITVDVEVSAAAFWEEETTAIQMVFHDITERRRAELILRESERRQRALARQLLESQENERRHLSSELHDDTGQTLTAIKITLQAAQRIADATSQPLLEETIKLTERALEQVRRLSVDLRPAALDNLGLVPSIRGLLDREGQRSRLTTHLDAEVLTPRLSPELETACFRVVQEALTNVIRHAQAREVWVRVRERDQELYLSIRDDGVGFDVETARDRATRGASLGLLGLQERVQIVGGRIEFHSTPSHGTEVRVQVPLTPADRLEKASTTNDGADSGVAR